MGDGGWGSGGPGLLAGLGGLQGHAEERGDGEQDGEVEEIEPAGRLGGAGVVRLRVAAGQADRKSSSAVIGVPPSPFGPSSRPRAGAGVSPPSLSCFGRSGTFLQGDRTGIGVLAPGGGHYADGPPTPGRRPAMRILLVTSF